MRRASRVPHGGINTTDLKRSRAPSHDVRMRIVITGAGRGIGLGLVRAYLERGEIVHAGARQPERADDLHRLAATSAGRLHIHRLDVTVDSDAAELARSVGDGAIDLLVNNAGVGSKFARITDTSMQECLTAFDVNALGALRMVRALLPGLVAARGKVVNISTMLASQTDNSTGRNYPYRMSKIALNMATRSLAVELREPGVTVVALHPGWVQTEMGGPKATTPVPEAVAQLVATVDKLGLAQSGTFIGPDGDAIAW